MRKSPAFAVPFPRDWPMSPPPATNDIYTYRLNVADADGAREKLVLESGEPIMSPAWSANGKELAYVSFETGRPAIFRQNLVTAQREQLTNFTGLNGAPSWSPDGTQMALVLSKDGNPELYLLDLQSGKVLSSDSALCH